MIKLAEILKGQIKTNKEAKQMISDAVTLIGQAQFNLSLRRRYTHSITTAQVPSQQYKFCDQFIKLCNCQKQRRAANQLFSSQTASFSVCGQKSKTVRSLAELPIRCS